MKVLILSWAFPVSHGRKGQLTEFLAKYKRREKLHTIRANVKGHFKAGEKVSVRQWSGKPYATKQLQIGTDVIGIEPVRIVNASNGLHAFVGDERINVQDLIRNDGLTHNDFRDWFFPTGQFGEFRGDILHFTDFRYVEGAV